MIFTEEREFIRRIARCEILTAAGDDHDGSSVSLLLSSGSRVSVSLAGVVDVEKECRKAKAELEKLSAQLGALERRLSNPGFTDRAPAHVVDAERQKQRDWTMRKAQLSEKVVSLCGSGA